MTVVGWPWWLGSTREGVRGKAAYHVQLTHSNETRHFGGPGRGLRVTIISALCARSIKAAAYFSFFLVGQFVSR